MDGDTAKQILAYSTYSDISKMKGHLVDSASLFGYEFVAWDKTVEEIKGLGEIFDPEIHEAVGSIQDDTKGEKEIVQEYRKGYKLGHKVIRHSMVVVAN